MELRIHDSIVAKIGQKHDLSSKEIEECFLNRDGNYLYDRREDHQTIPPTLWFIAETNKGRKVKVCFISDPDGPILKTAYEPNIKEIEIYQRYGY